MILAVKIFFYYQVGNLIPGAVVDHQATQNGLFRFNRMWR
jgi:hypothetical protein